MAETARILVRDPNRSNRCTATSKRSGERCGKDAMRGMRVCYWHGGAAGQVRAKARRRLAEDAVRRSLEQVEVREIEDPIGELMRLSGEVVAWKDALASHVAALQDRYRFTDDKGAEHLDARVALYERAMDRCRHFLETWVKLGIDERLVRVEETKRDRLAQAFARALDDVADRLPADVRQDLQVALGRRLRELVEGA